jgi:phage terminase large subunit
VEPTFGAARYGGSAVEIAGFDFGYGGPDPSACVRAYIIPADSCDWDDPDDRRPVLYVAGESVHRGVANHELQNLAREAEARSVYYDSANPIMGEALNAAGVHA